jgi:ABC-type transport system substrate-binding protein
MQRGFRALASATGLLIACLVAEPGFAQKPGGVLQVAHRDSPASMSTLEEVTISTVAPMMAVFNNLVIFDQHVPQNTLQSIVPDLATGWSWNEDGTELTFRLREGVCWHDGQPFAAKNVQCMPPDRLRTLPGYDPDVRNNRREARDIMRRLGYGPDHPLAVKVAARNIPLYRDPAVMLIDQLKEIFIAGELDIVETANWNPKVTRQDYMVGLENTGSAVVDDPDQQLYESYACDSDRNFTGYCNREIEDLFHRQWRETDQARRKELVWDIDATLQQEGARPVIFHTRGATCWHPQVKGLTTMVNGWRMEDIWLDR